MEILLGSKITDSRGFPLTAKVPLRTQPLPFPATNCFLARCTVNPCQEIGPLCFKQKDRHVLGGWEIRESTIVRRMLSNVEVCFTQSREHCSISTCHREVIERLRTPSHPQGVLVEVDDKTDEAKRNVDRKPLTTDETEGMLAAQYTPGGPENLYIGEVPLPEPQEHEVRIKVYASAINRADTLQRKGRYDPPPGVTNILGLEAAGVIDKVGPHCPNSVTAGQRVSALLSGGGNAEYITCRHEHTMPIPDTLTMIQAAAIPEVWLTAFQLLYFVGKLQKHDRVLIHAGGSGVGTAAVQLVKHAGAIPIVTAGTQDKIDFAISLGATAGINYKDGGFGEKVLQLTAGQGVNLILDCVGASMFEENLKALAVDGQWINYGLLGGSMVNANLAQLLLKRATLTFSTLRSRSVEYKASLVREFAELATPLFANGTFRPIIYKVFPLSEIAQAHSLIETNENIGKIILKVRDDEIKKDEF